MWQFKYNPYCQAFCEQIDFSLDFPCDRTELVHFRKRAGKERDKNKFQVCVWMRGETVLEPIVTIDTRVTERNIAYPMDEKLTKKNISRLLTLDKANTVGMLLLFKQIFRLKKIFERVYKIFTQGEVGRNRFEWFYRVGKPEFSTIPGLSTCL